MSGKRVNCVYNDHGAWCKNKKTPRAFYVFGARCCALYHDDDATCDLRVMTKRPQTKPPAQT